jgi:hypothetical protein
MLLENTYKLLAGSPNVDATNISGTAYSSSSGTPTHEGIWRIKIRTGISTEAPLMADVVEVRDFNERRTVPVATSGTFTLLIAGLSVVLAGAVNGNEFEIAYSSIVADTV